MAAFHDATSWSGRPSTTEVLAPAGGGPSAQTTSTMGVLGLASPVNAAKSVGAPVTMTIRPRRGVPRNRANIGPSEESRSGVRMASSSRSRDSRLTPPVWPWPIVRPVVVVIAQLRPDRWRRIPIDAVASMAAS